MALEVTMSGSIEFDDNISQANFSVESRQQTAADPTPAELVQNIGITEEVINLGGIATIGAFGLQNLDDVNFITILDGTGGNEVAELGPDVNGDGKGGFLIMSKAGDGFQAPWAIADTDICRLRVFAVAR